MIIENKLGKLGKTQKSVETVPIEWFECDKKLLRKITSAGEEIGIKVSERLDDGDILYEDENRIIAVSLIPCNLINIKVSNMREMGKLCFELGNRHLSLSINEDCVKVPYDEPTYEYLNKLGFVTQKVHEQFIGFTECHAHSHGSNEKDHKHHHEH